MNELQRCAVSGCNEPKVGSLDFRPLCRTHFIATCYEQMEEYARLLEGRQFQGTSAETLRRFLTECTRQAADLAHSVGDLDNLERARLLDILQRATELGQHLRRSARKVMAVAIKLRYEKLGHGWEEDTLTRVLSYYGALIECRHPVEIGDLLVLTRTDTGRKVRARVAWRRRRKNAPAEVGLEFLNCDNFWDLDWEESEAVLAEPEPVTDIAHE